MALISVRPLRQSQKSAQWYKHEKRDENIAEGRQMLDKEFKRHGINLSDEAIVPMFIEKLLMKKQYVTPWTMFYAAVGYGGIQLWKVNAEAQGRTIRTHMPSDIEEIDVPQARRKATEGIRGRCN